MEGRCSPCSPQKVELQVLISDRYNMSVCVQSDEGMFEHRRELESTCSGRKQLDRSEHEA